MTVSAIIVTYNPDMALLRRAAGSLAPQVHKLYVIDNGSAQADAIASEFGGGNASVVPLGGNMGIAAATNAGLKLAADGGADWIITSDQDTIYPPDYVSTIRRILRSGDLDSDALAALVPSLYEEVAGEVSLLTVKSKLGIRTVPPEAPYTKVFQAIASGMVIKARALGTIGGMDEDLFIDWVDFEWCWRANRKGYAVVSCGDLIIRHRLGDASKKIGTRKYALHSHVRNYYITRNSFHLALRTRYLAWPDKLLLFVRSFRFIPLYTLLCHEHLLNLRYTSMGMLDAFRGRMGMLREPGRCPPSSGGSTND